MTQFVSAWERDRVEWETLVGVCVAGTWQVFKRHIPMEIISRVSVPVRE